MYKIAVIFVVALITLAVANVDSDRSKFKKAHDECQADPNAKLAEVPRGQRPPNDEHVKAHVLCMSKKLGLQDEHGKVVKGEIKSVLSHYITDSAKLEEAVTKCAVEKDSPEETAKDIWDCMRPVVAPRPPGPPPPRHH